MTWDFKSERQVKKEMAEASRPKHTRVCLRCDKRFHPTGSANFMCPECRKAADRFYTAGYNEYDYGFAK